MGRLGREVSGPEAVKDAELVAKKNLFCFEDGDGGLKIVDDVSSIP